MSKTEREAVVKVLSEKFKEKTAKEYEKKIFDLSQRIKKEYALVAYEKAGQIMLADDANLILNDIENNRADWDCSTYDAYKKIKEKQYEKILFKPSTVKGVYNCKECGSDEFFAWQAQTRSADEGTTQFRQCARCGKRNKE
jgi:DNA-directed RNA polymerase subunit M/transcription elongation factor TFIIS